MDGIAAIVNGDVIASSQVRQLSAPREKLLRSQFTGQDLENKLQEVRKLAVKDLIDRRLIIQAFKKESFQIPVALWTSSCTIRPGELWRRPQYVCQDARGPELLAGWGQGKGDGKNNRPGDAQPQC